MSQKQIRRGDIVSIRHYNSCHQFIENSVCGVLDTYPKRSEFPDRFKCATRTEWWYVDIKDITLFSRNKNEDDDY